MPLEFPAFLTVPLALEFPAFLRLPLALEFPAFPGLPLTPEFPGSIELPDFAIKEEALKKEDVAGKTLWGRR